MPQIGILGAIGLGLGAVGGGLSFMAQSSAARTAETFSTLNAQAGAQQATQQAQTASLQSQIQAAQAQAASDAAANNASAIRDQTDSDTAQAQENVRRQREEFQRQISQAVAQGGASGVNLFTGSPLELLLNASEQEQQSELDAQWGINAQRQQGYRQAAGAALGGRVQDLNSNLLMLESQASIQAGRTAASQARLQGLAGQSQAAGMRAGAFAGLLGSGSNLAFQARRYF